MECSRSRFSYIIREEQLVFFTWSRLTTWLNYFDRMSDVLPSPIINWQGGHCVPPAYSLAVLGTKNTHWWCYLCFKQNKMNRTKAVEVSHCNISIYVTNVESNYDIKKKHGLMQASTMPAWHGKRRRSEPQWLEQCLGVHTYPLTQYPAFLHTCWLLSIVLSALPLLLLIRIVNPAKWVALYFLLQMRILRLRSVSFHMPAMMLACI